MTKSLLVLGLNFILIVLPANTLFYQDSLPVIRSETRDIKIKFNEGLSIDWHLEPGKNPDVFEIGSTLKNKSVKFITDEDSISFEVNAGQKINFVILLNHSIKCYTQIRALEDPFFIRNRIAITLLILLVIIGISAFIFRNKISTAGLLQMGVVAPLIFWIMTIVGASIHGHYSHLANTISRLGEIGSGAEIFMAISTWVVALSSVLFFLGCYKATEILKINSLPVWLSLSMPISMAWASVFASGHELHSALGPFPFLLLVGIAVSIFTWRGDLYKPLIILSIVSLLAMSLLSLRLVPEIQHHAEGLLQRCFYFGWTVWSFALVFYFSIWIKPFYDEPCQDSAIRSK